MVKTYPTFEEFLKDIHYEYFPTLLDDELPDHFTNWTAELGYEDWTEFGNRYAKKIIEIQNNGQE